MSTFRRIGMLNASEQKFAKQVEKFAETAMINVVAAV